MTERRYDFATVADIVASARARIDPWNPAVEKEVKVASRGHGRHMRSIARAKTLEEARRRFQHALHSPACRLMAAICSWRGVSRSLGYFQGIADEVNLRQSQLSKLIVQVIAKADGGHRAISQFGHVDGAKQVLLRDILLAKFGHSIFEHARKGHGRDTLVCGILRSIEEKETDYLIEADILDCFPSVNRKALSAILGLPSSVIRNTVAIGPHTSISFSNNLDHHISEQRVRAGLPLGSRVSPYIMSKLVESVLRKFKGPLALSYVDNVWLGAESQEEAAAKMDALAVLFRQHPAGPFPLKYTNTRTIDDFNHVLGYWIRRQTKPYPGIARALPSPWAINAGQRKLAALLTYHVPGDEMTGSVEAWAANWANSFGAWSGRRDGQTLAINDGLEYVWQHQRKFVEQNLGRRFRSFAELKKTSDLHAESLPLNPHYRPYGWTGLFPSVSPH